MTVGKKKKRRGKKNEKGPSGLNFELTCFNFVLFCLIFCLFTLNVGLSGFLKKDQ